MRPLLIAICLVGCAGAAEPAPVPPPPPPSTPTPPADSPCTVDSECRLYDGPACSCSIALTSASVTPSQTPCFAPPCMNREAYCDVAASRCAIRTATPPPPSTEPAPTLGDIAPIS